ncbi:hypothetical protein RE943_47450 (plasmid) [Prescottella equi]|uniref:transglycosylase SLT domain-containing protein n=1 Tax=Rhodococcus hoagii TaxID=43767 RepID=UPI001C778AE7|nr:transglycosylase SLT domain-containing protein [Prescottella equi]BCN71272.1 hypothetical protein RE943_47450 [Prescottella equi]BCN76208.1 hypothetical protein RE0327_48070 [Prescottella equi]BCN81225.1 hypothetical protein RE0346_48850 [Prescottella equi]
MFSTTARRAALATATAGAAAAALLAAPATAAADTPGRALDRALDRVPVAFAPWVHAAPLLCPAAQISPAFIAAQLDAESGFDAAAVGPAGQAGPAQLTPQTAAAFLVDADLSGTASPHDIGDAVVALVGADCDLVDRLTAAGKPTDPETIAAAYIGGGANVDHPIAREYARAVTGRL